MTKSFGARTASKFNGCEECTLPHRYILARVENKINMTSFATSRQQFFVTLDLFYIKILYYIL